MTPEDDARDERALTAEEEAEVRRLLAEAGGPVPTPPDVVAMLEATLADLVAEGADADAEDDTDSDTEGDSDSEPAPVTSLVGRRRRWPRVLLAAAAVVVGGYAVGSAVTGTMAGSDSDSDASGGSSLAEGSAADSGGTDSGGAESGDSLSAQPDQPRDGLLSTLAGRRPLVVSDELAATVRAAVRRDLALRSAQDSAAAPRDLGGTANGRCAVPPSTAKDRWFVVQYEGHRATLVVGPVRQGMVTAAVYSCDGTRLLRADEVDVDP